MRGVNVFDELKLPQCEKEEENFIFGNITSNSLAPPKCEHCLPPCNNKKYEFKVLAFLIYFKIHIFSCLLLGSWKKPWYKQDYSEDQCRKILHERIKGSTGFQLSKSDGLSGRLSWTLHRVVSLWCHQLHCGHCCHHHTQRVLKNRILPRETQHNCLNYFDIDSIKNIYLIYVKQNKTSVSHMRQVD